MIAVLADIHGNKEALDAVLDDMRRYDVTKIICLGDLIDYGADSEYVIKKMDSLRSSYSTTFVRGNHDSALLNEKDNHFRTDHAKKSFDITKSEISSQSKWILSNLSEYYQVTTEWYTASHVGIPKTINVKGCLTGDPGKVTIPDLDKFLGLREGKPVFFGGHTHIQGYQLGDFSVYINPGSVGQPRNMDTRAQYVVIEADRVIFRRVEYDIDKAARKIVESGRPKFLATRLYLGI